MNAVVLILMASLSIAGARRGDLAPFVVVLGTAQDGGLPQAGCQDDPCRRARGDARRRRLVASLLVVDPRTGRRWLIDATPDFEEQVALADAMAPRAAAPGRPPLFDGIFLTHAHAGHYAGLLQLGREAHGSRGQVVHATARFREFLERDRPWSLLVEQGHVTLATLEPGVPVALAGDLSITPLLVPHRDEVSDTVAFVVAGPSRRLLYVPDIDKWERWDRRIEDVLAGVDVALVDGTFFADGEIPGRAMADIPHPFIEETIARLAALPASERAKVVFTHLNHTNPAASPRGPAARAVRAAGMRVAHDGDRHAL